MNWNKIHMHKIELNIAINNKLSRNSVSGGYVMFMMVKINMVVKGVSKPIKTICKDQVFRTVA